MNEVITAELRGQDRLQAYPVDGGKHWRLSWVGCKSVSKLMQNLQAEMDSSKEWTLPQGNSHADILVRELILKMRGQWSFPLAQDELCHCRAIPTQIVDQAIVAGAHDISKVRRWTSANTACGTCLPDVQALFDFRLHRP